MRKAVASAGLLTVVSMSIFAVSQTNLNSYAKLPAYGSTSVENFVIDGEQYFASQDKSSFEHYYAVRIYQHTPTEGNEFNLIQAFSPYEDNPNSYGISSLTEFFSTPSGHYLAVMHKIGPSSIYKWDANSKNFLFDQSIVHPQELRMDNHNIRVFSEGDKQFIAIIHGQSGASQVLIFQEKNGKWDPVQILELPYDPILYDYEPAIDFLGSGDDVFLLIPLERGASSKEEEGIYMYRWNGSEFVYDSLYSGANTIMDMEVFNYKDETYVATAGCSGGGVNQANFLFTWEKSTSSLKQIADLPTCSNRIAVTKNNPEALYLVGIMPSSDSYTNHVLQVNFSDNAPAKPSAEVLYKLNTNDTSQGAHNATSYYLDGNNYILTAAGYIFEGFIYAYKFESGSKNEGQQQNIEPKK